MSTIGASATAVALSLAVAGAAAPASASAAVDADGYYAYADVVEAIPHYRWREQSEPVLQCAQALDEPSRYSRHTGHRLRGDRYADDHRDDHRGSGDGVAGLVGGLIGGLIGHQFGGGNGKTALTIAGAAVGASVARQHVRGADRRVQSSRSSHYGSERHCTETYRTRRVRAIDGYDVTYRYQGATFHKWMDAHPGDAVRVHVAVEPMAADAGRSFRMDSSSRR